MGDLLPINAAVEAEHTNKGIAPFAGQRVHWQHGHSAIPWRCDLIL
jgi:hypothetical protein